LRPVFYDVGKIHATVCVVGSYDSRWSG